MIVKCANSNCGIEFNLTKGQLARKKWGAQNFYHQRSCIKNTIATFRRKGEVKNFYPYE